MLTSTSAGRVISAAHDGDEHAPRWPAPCAAVTFDQSAEPGIAPSRLNANVIRDALVMQDVRAEELAERRDRAAIGDGPVLVRATDVKMYGDTAAADPGVVGLPAASSGTANRNASSRIQPPIAE